MNSITGMGTNPLFAASSEGPKKRRSTRKKTTPEKPKPAEDEFTPRTKRPAPPKGSGGSPPPNPELTETPDTYRITQPEPPEPEPPPTAIEKRIDSLTKDIMEKRNRQTYMELQSGYGFKYGGQRLSALTILEVLYNRDQKGSEKDLTKDYFTQLEQESYQARTQFSEALEHLRKNGFLEESYGDASDYDLKRPNSNMPWRKLTVTEVGKGVVEQYHADVESGETTAQNEEKPAAKAEETQATPKVTIPSEQKLLLKALLEPSNWGITGIRVLKALQGIPDQRTGLRKFLEAWVPFFPISKSAKGWIPTEILMKALAIPADKKTKPLEQLRKADLVELSDNWVRLTGVGKKAVSKENLWDTGIMTTKDLEVLAQEPLEACRNALKELRRLMSEFEEAYQKADTDFTQTRAQAEALNAEAVKLLQKSKAPDISDEARKKHVESALKKKEEVKALEKSLKEDKQWLLDQAINQLDMAQTIEEKMAGDIQHRFRQAQQDQVMLKLAILQNNLADFVSQWTTDSSTLENPIQGFRLALQQKWKGHDIDTSDDAASTREIRKRVEERLKRNQQAALKDELEAELEATTQKSVAEVVEADSATPPASSETPAKTLEQNAGSSSGSDPKP